jgi:hypothetical protein
MIYKKSYDVAEYFSREGSRTETSPSDRVRNWVIVNRYRLPTYANHELAERPSAETRTAR